MGVNNRRNTKGLSTSRSPADEAQYIPVIGNNKSKIIFLVGIVAIVLVIGFLFLSPTFKKGFAGKAIGASSGRCSDTQVCTGYREFCDRSFCYQQVGDYQSCDPSVRLVGSSSSQCLGRPDFATPRPSSCFQASKTTSLYGNSISSGNYYCLPENLATDGYQVCAADNQCQQGICEIPGSGRAPSCIRQQLGATQPCLYDRQCQGYDASSNSDACFGEDLAQFRSGVCRDQLKPPSVLFTATTQSIPTPSHDLYITPGDTVTFQISARSDTNSGPLHCYTPPNTDPANPYNPNYFNYNANPVNDQTQQFNIHTGSLSTNLIRQNTPFTMRCQNDVSFQDVVVNVYTQPNAPVDTTGCAEDPMRCLQSFFRFRSPSLNQGTTFGQPNYCYWLARGSPTGDSIAGCIDNNELPSATLSEATVYGNPQHHAQNVNSLYRGVSSQFLEGYYSLDGNGDYVAQKLVTVSSGTSTESDFDVSYPQGFTVSFWINPDLSVTREEGLFSLGRTSEAKDAAPLILLRRHNGYVQWFLNKNYQPVVGGPHLTRGWNHIVLATKLIPVTPGPDYREYTLYVNGKPVAYYLETDGIVNDFITARTTGYFGSGYSDSFTGGLDDIRVYSTALTSDQVDDLFREQNTILQVQLPPLASTQLNSCVSEGWRDNTRYTLIQDITSSHNCMVIDKPGVVLDCQGHFIQGTPANGNLPPTVGISIRSSGVRIENCNLRGFDVGMRSEGYLNYLIFDAALENNWVFAQQKAVELLDLVGRTILRGNVFLGSQTASEGVRLFQDPSQDPTIQLDNNVICGFSLATGGGEDVSCQLTNPNAQITSANNIFDRQLGCGSITAAQSCTPGAIYPIPNSQRSSTTYILTELLTPASPVDTDADGVPDTTDNCPTISNGVSPLCITVIDSSLCNQADTDNDGLGNACDENEELCRNGFDDDTDGLIDCADPECIGDIGFGTYECCQTSASCDVTGQQCINNECKLPVSDVDGDGIPDTADEAASCADRQDNDHDNLIDCEDSECSGFIGPNGRICCRSSGSCYPSNSGLQCFLNECLLVVCGDGQRDGFEMCDDRNALNNDGCSSSCAEEVGWDCREDAVGFSTCHTTCGDGLTAGAENCDDGNKLSGDGCSNTCQAESGWLCSAGNPSICSICGDGVITRNEECDDGNIINSDGCSALCQIEKYWTCSGSGPSVCSSNVCGDGNVDTGEQCDDNNAVSDDGCAKDCSVESNYVCNGQPSFCSQCGDGNVEWVDRNRDSIFQTGEGEQCDDGNIINGDGCSFTCMIESSTTSFVLGDVNGDGRVDQSDALRILQYVTGVGTLTSAQLQAGDVSCDSQVNTGDAIQILRLEAGLRGVFSCP